MIQGTGRKCVALTFDAEYPDRPHSLPGSEERILDVLADARIQATFFIEGRWANAHPATVQRIASDGHAIGNHSFSHTRMSMLTTRGIKAEILSAERAIERLTNVNPRPWFRCPFGEGVRDPRLRVTLSILGYKHVGWNVVGGDFQPRRSEEEVRDAVLNGLRAVNGISVVVLHTWPKTTPRSISAIIDELLRGDVHFVTVANVPRGLIPATPGRSSGWDRFGRRGGLAGRGLR